MAVLKARRTDVSTITGRVAEGPPVRYVVEVHACIDGPSVTVATVSSNTLSTTEPKGRVRSAPMARPLHQA